eukprot:8356792-Karenia_brevis.AAC.1
MRLQDDIGACKSLLHRRSPVATEIFVAQPPLSAAVQIRNYCDSLHPTFRLPGFPSESRSHDSSGLMAPCPSESRFHDSLGLP